jgi:N-acetylmuramic acid 6-phosphate (MurNAc-6-P) etherase
MQKGGRFAFAGAASVATVAVVDAPVTIPATGVRLAVADSC